MDAPTFYTMIINLTVCLLILLAYSFQTDILSFVPNQLESYYNDSYPKLPVNCFDATIKAHHLPSRKVMTNCFLRKIGGLHDTIPNHPWSKNPEFGRHMAMGSRISGILSTWLLMIMMTEGAILYRYELALASLYPGILRCELPDEQDSGHRLRSSYGVQIGPGSHLGGRAFADFDEHLMVYDDSKQATHSTTLHWDGLYTTEDFDNTDERAIEIRTKSETYITDGHLVLITENELSVQKYDSLVRHRLWDTRGRQQSVEHSKTRLETVYRSSTLVFIRPLDDPAITNYQDQLESATSFSIVMQIIIVTLLLEITRNGLSPRSSA